MVQPTALRRDVLCIEVNSIPCFYRGGARGRWYKFNDNVVKEFDMNDETLEYECFGGEYRPKVYDQCKPSAHKRAPINLARSSS